MIILVDDPKRENEGDLVCAAEKTTPEIVNFMAAHGRGWICLTLTQEKADHLDLPLMVPSHENQSNFGTAFTITFEARRGVTTGISAEERATSILTAARDDCRSQDVDVNTQACVSCGGGDHDDDAVYCKHCGAAIHPEEGTVEA